MFTPWKRLNDSEPAARMRRTWDAGRDFLARSASEGFRGARALPWYVVLGQDDAERRAVVGNAAVVGADLGRNGEFAWHFGKKAVWLDAGFALRREEAERWTLFLEGLADGGGPERLAGVVVVLDARRLLDEDEPGLGAEAALLRSRLDQLMRKTGVRVPVNLLVSRIDVLYGMRSLVAGLESEILDQPLGASGDEIGGTPGEFAVRALERAATALCRMVRKKTRHSARDDGAARLQAPDELLRLAKPLAAFCAEAFDDNPYQLLPALDGVYCGSSGPRGGTVPPLQARFSSFRPEKETQPPVRDWFWGTLLREALPLRARPPVAVRRGGFRRALAGRAGLASFMAGTVALCWLMTLSFLESRRVLTSVAGGIKTPTAEAELSPLLDLAMRTDLRNRDWRLPRFGMVEALRVEGEMKRRYVAAYHELKAGPEYERASRRTRTALAGGAPGDIGNAVFALAAPRGDGTDVATAGAAARGGIQREMYRRWSAGGAAAHGRQNIDILERRLLGEALDGDLMRWLPDWVGGLPGVAAVEGAAVWSPVEAPADLAADLRVDGAWTAGAYALVRQLLENADVPDGDWPERRRAVLAEYRRRTLERWRRAVDGMWLGYRDNIRDADLKTLALQLARGEGPAFRMAALLRRHLLPIFAENDGNPDVVWLRRYCDLLAEKPAAKTGGGSIAESGAGLVERVLERVSWRHDADAESVRMRRGLSLLADGESGDGAGERLFAAFHRVAAAMDSEKEALDLVRGQFRRGSDLPAGPFAEAKAAAGELLAQLRAASSSTAWEGISPAAVYNYLCFLATRHAAASLDRAWRERVYDRHRLASGTEEERFGRLVGKEGLLESFLGDEALGFWRAGPEGMVNAEWNRASFPFSRDFFFFCARAMQFGRTKFPEKVALPFRVEALNVDPGARERPHYAEFVVNERGTVQKLTFRNYSAETAFDWRLDRRAVAGIRIVFPSLVLTREFLGEKALGDFVRAFDRGFCVLGPEDFPGQADALRRLGITRMVIRGGFSNREEFFARYDGFELSFPKSIIVPGGAPSAPDDAAPGGDERRRIAFPEAKDLAGLLRVSYSEGE